MSFLCKGVVAYVLGPILYYYIHRVNCSSNLTHAQMHTQSYCGILSRKANLHLLLYLRVKEHSLWVAEIFIIQNPVGYERTMRYVFVKVTLAWD